MIGATAFFIWMYLEKRTARLSVQSNCQVKLDLTKQVTVLIVLYPLIPYFTFYL